MIFYQLDLMDINGSYKMNFARQKYHEKCNKLGLSSGKKKTNVITDVSTMEKIHQFIKY